jgi:quercetin dioxygenase-like cupin family protein
MNTANWTNAPTSEVYPGISRQSIDGEKQTLVRYVYQPGAVFPIHSHVQEQITTVLTGEIEFTVDGVPTVFRAGDVAVIPSLVPHGARVIGTVAVETFNALSPRRETHPAPEQ